MIIVPRESSSHWYFPDGTPLHEVPRADGKGSRPTSLRDARKLGLFPSVTNVLSILAKPALDAWKQEQAILAALTLPRIDNEPLDAFARRVVTDMQSEVGRAADLGSAVHAAIEGYAQGRWLPENKQVASLFEPARQWFDADVVAVHSVEIAAAHTAWGYAGRVDLVATLKSTGRPTVIDFKTQKTRRDKDGGFKPILHDTWPLQLEAYRQALVSRDKGLHASSTATARAAARTPAPISPTLPTPDVPSSAPRSPRNAMTKCASGSPPRSWPAADSSTLPT